MTSTTGIFIGVNISGGQRPHAYVALDDQCKVAAVGRGRRKELLAYLAGLGQARVAFNGPAAPQQWDFISQRAEATLFPLVDLGLTGADAQPGPELMTGNIQVERIPMEESRCPGWMRNGFALWQVLLGWGFQRYPPVDAPRLVIETRSQVGFALLLGIAPYPETTLEGRLQRQMALRQQRLPVPDPMNVLEEITPYRLLNGKLPLEKILAAEDLNAWLAAWTAWLSAHQPDRVRCWGAEDTGQVVLVNKL